MHIRIHRVVWAVALTSLLGLAQPALALDVNESTGQGTGHGWNQDSPPTQAQWTFVGNVTCVVTPVFPASKSYSFQAGAITATFVRAAGYIDALVDVQGTLDEYSGETKTRTWWQDSWADDFVLDIVNADPTVLTAQPNDFGPIAGGLVIKYELLSGGTNKRTVGF